MVREVKFKAQRSFEGQWEGLLMMGGCGDATVDWGEPEISSSTHLLQLSQLKETLLLVKLCAQRPSLDRDKRKYESF